MSRSSWVVVVCVLAPIGASAQDAIVNAGLEEEPPIVETGPIAPAQSIEAEAQLAPIQVELSVEQAPPQQEAAPVARERPRREAPRREELPPPPQAIFLHGFRLGYLHILNTDTPLYGGTPSQIYAERYDMRAPHLFMIGYEAVWRMVGYEWLNLLLIGNVMFAGFEQSRFFPSANLMLGFEFAQMVQVGLGVSVTPTKEEPAHLILAAGWTPQIGSFFVPIHAFFVPDIEGHHKLGLTVGITFF